MSEEDDYGLSPTKEIVEIDAPAVDYRPRTPKSYRPKIAMIGTGGISEFHLKAYRKCGYETYRLDAFHHSAQPTFTYDCLGELV